MALIVLTFLLITAAVAAMSIGVLFGREPIKGSCGGLSCIKSVACAGCTRRDAAGEQP